MKCPVCLDRALCKKELEPALHCHSCNTCDGIWIRPDTYTNWLENDKLTGREISSEKIESLEKSGLKFCPGCSHAMIKFKVGGSHNFNLDRCGSCHSVWFDGNEWLLLQASDLSSNIYAVFTDSYQRKIRLGEKEEAIKSMWKERLGGEDYAEMKRIINWLSDHEKSNELLAFQFSSMNINR